MIVSLLLAASLAGPASAGRSTLVVGCDPRLDLLGVVQALAGWRKDEPRLPHSMADLTTRFEKWKDHPVVRTYARTAERHGGDESYVLILTALSDPPALAWVHPRRVLSPDFIARAGGDAEVDAAAARCSGSRRVPASAARPAASPSASWGGETPWRRSRIIWGCSSTRGCAWRCR